MAGRRLRSILEPVLYFGIAALLHSALFLLPAGIPAKKETVTTQRGVRVRAFVERPPAPASPAQEMPTPLKSLVQPPVADIQAAMPPTGSGRAPEPQGGGGTASGGMPSSGSPPTGGNPSVPSSSGAGNSNGEPSKFTNFLAGLKSSGVRGASREAAEKSLRAYKGGERESGTTSWGTRTEGTGTGLGIGGGKGKGDYLDPRVKMVVNSYPSTGIERRYTQIPYPNIKVRQGSFTRGWVNVYLKIHIDSEGNQAHVEVLRPENGGQWERQFLDQVQREVAKWPFDHKEAEIHVDVRFYVE
ncbi:MAG TPA: hypothetical protein VIU40_15685 [Geobacteraceae bacterium]